MSQSQYEAIALKIVPPSHRRSVGELRDMIAQALADEVNKALAKQREKEFPELAQVRVDLEWKHKEVEKARVEADKHDRDMKARESSLRASEERLAALLMAFERYLAWLDGDGAVDENGKRFTALREAYRQFKGGKA